jgi:predicted unusual protein kinase regulating ubiquinone biosynthesis (AarF/ABC1/UbiB family)
VTSRRTWVRLTRTARVWRLTARNAGRWVLHRIRRRVTRGERRADLDAAYSLRTADDVARELGSMKGALMKAGQLLGFVVEALPDEAQRSLSTLFSDAPAMAPSLAAQVVTDEFGAPPERLFLDWSPEPAAAASIGQVHRAVTRDGREVAVKVQYPGIAASIEADLANADLLYRMVSAFSLKGLDTRALVDELRMRMRDELDYRLEAANLTEFARRFDGHPFVRLPTLVPSTAAPRYSRPNGSTDCRGTGSSTSPPPRRASGPARSCGGSPSTPSTVSACSTATPTPATTCSRPTAM